MFEDFAGKALDLHWASVRWNPVFEGCREKQWLAPGWITACCLKRAIPGMHTKSILFPGPGSAGLFFFDMDIEITIVVPGKFF